MAHLNFILIGIAWIIITRFLYLKNFELFLVSLIPINYNFFHLVPRIGVYDNYQESLLVIVLFYFIETCFIAKIIHRNQDICEKTSEYDNIIYFFFAVIFYAFVLALLRGQGIVLTIKVAKLYPLLLIYYIISYNNIDIDKFCKYFVMLALLVALLTSIQYIFINKISIFYFYADAASHLRYGSYRGIRIVEGSIIISIATIISFAYLLKSFSWKYLLYTLALFAQLCLVVKTRVEIFGILLTILIVSYLYSRETFSKMVTFAYILLVCITLLFQFGITQSYFIKHFSLVAGTISDFVGLSAPTSHGDLSIRKRCFDYYLGDILRNNFLGRGLLSTVWSGSTEIYEMNVLHFYLADIGIMRTFVFFGLPGIALVLYALFCFVRKFFSRLVHDYPEIIAFFVYGITILPFTDIFFSTRNFFLFAIFLALLGKIDSNATC